MNNQDRSLKILLALLAVGVWGLLLRPMVSPTQVAAQLSKQRAPQYALAIHYKNGSRKTVFAAKPVMAPAPSKEYYTTIGKFDLEKAVKAGVGKGWRIHTISESDGYFTVLFEK